MTLGGQYFLLSSALLACFTSCATFSAMAGLWYLEVQTSVLDRVDVLLVVTQRA
jgi:hypothetical protein